jgi:hypothetical protein
VTAFKPLPLRFLARFEFSTMGASKDRHNWFVLDGVRSKDTHMQVLHLQELPKKRISLHQTKYCSYSYPVSLKF